MWLLWLAACGGGTTYIVEGQVLDKTSPTTIVVDHDPIAGFMPAMTMPFEVKDPSLVAEVVPGDRILARLVVDDGSSWLAAVRVVGHDELPASFVPAVGPIGPGQLFPGVDVLTHDGTTIRVGEGQTAPTALTFLYTRCPMPEFCPAMTARLQALQGVLPPEARIVEITLDPEYDTLPVLAAYAEAAGAGPRWRLGRVDDVTPLVERAGMRVSREGGEILHANRLLVLDGEGRLVRRYDDTAFDLDEVAGMLLP